MRLVKETQTLLTLHLSHKLIQFLEPRLSKSSKLKVEVQTNLIGI